MTNFASIGGLSYVEGQLTISSNQRLTSLQGLELLTVVAGGLVIENNPELVDLSQLAASAGELSVGADEHGHRYFFVMCNPMLSPDELDALETLIGGECAPGRCYGNAGETSCY